jgi:MFS family permease
MDAAAEPAAVAARRAQVNSAVSVWAAAAIISFGPALLFNLMPLVLSSLATAHSLGPAQVGLFASACQAGSMVSTLASALWVRRVRSWPRATVVSALLTAAAYGCIMAVDGASYPATLAFAFVTGCGNGSLHAAPTALLSDTKSPTRGFALTIGLQVLAAGAVAPFAPAIQARWGFPGMIGVLSAFTALCAALSLLLPLQGLRGSSVGASAFGCLMLGGSGSEHSYTTFRLALLQLNVWWNGAASVMSGVIATLDRSGRFAVLSQAYAIGIAKHTQPTYPSTTSNETTLLSLVTS